MKVIVISLLCLSMQLSEARDIIVTGRVSTISGIPVTGASVIMNAGTARFGAQTSSDGSYSIRISGVYDAISQDFEAGIPYPVPFASSVYIPFIINKSGDIRFSVYTFSGTRIRDLIFKNISPGSYRITWDGCNSSGAPVGQGFYVYALSFGGNTRSGKLIKAPGFFSFPSSTTLEPVMLPPATPAATPNLTIPVSAEITRQGYYTLRQTDLHLSKDTIIDFIVAQSDALPFKTQGSYIAVKGETAYRPLILKGINLGSSPPGTFPGEIAYAIPDEMYESWINRIGEAGFNSIRVYTLHPPVFYEKLANYNNRHPDRPVYLFQGVWLDEVEDPSDPSQYDLIGREDSFSAGIAEVIDCIHGNKRISFRPGRAYGYYTTDISRWTAGYILGREISPQEIEKTNSLHPLLTSYQGASFSITGGSASEVFSARVLDYASSWEYQQYQSRRPLSFSSWPTLDPLAHTTETQTDEDKQSVNIMKITGKDQHGGIFATYHAYPYYPNFISEQPSYRLFSDGEGKNSYLGYLSDLKNHYSSIPLVIGEFGVPSSWGSAHQSFSNMDHGGYSEVQQGEKNLRMLRNMIDSDCAGGFMFAWMDEWFKPTWIVGYLEAFGFRSGNSTVPTRQLWHNLASPEQNFGLVSFAQKNTLPFAAYQLNNSQGPVRKASATHDNQFFFVDIETSQPVSSGDTIIICFDTYSRETGESKLPNGKTLQNRSEFILTAVAGKDTATFSVTEAYDMMGFTPRFNLSDPLKQKYKSTATNGAPWKTVGWINDQFLLTKQFPGLMPAENRGSFTPGSRSAVSWSGSLVKVRIPWTLLHFYDPTRMQVVNGAVSYDGGFNYEITSSLSDGIAISVYRQGSVISSSTRYTWTSWLTAPETVPVEKASLGIIEEGLKLIPGYAK